VRPDYLAHLAAAALAARRDALAAEQAVRGIDSLAEIELHPILASGFVAAELGTFSEVPYPGRAESRPNHSQRLRCDLVLTRSPLLPILDPVALLEAADAAAGTLFPAPPPPSGTPPDEAFWLEIKCVGQFATTAGIAGPCRAYATELLSLVPADIPKLARDPVIRNSGLMLILFTDDPRTAEQDLSAMLHRCLDRALPVGAPTIERFPIPDMIGNTACTVALIPVRHAHANI
jgi:hypothetical protein